MDFDDFTTYDTELANEGTWKPIRFNGNVLIELKIRYVDALTQSGELQYKKARARFAKMFKSGAMDEFDAAIIGLAYVNVVDWKGVTSKGKPIPYDAEAARQFFTKDSNRWMALDALKLANDAEAFAADLDTEFDVEEVTKN